MTKLLNLCNDEIERREDYNFEEIRNRAVELAKTGNAYNFTLFDDEYKLLGVDLNGIPVVIVEGADSRIVAGFVNGKEDAELLAKNSKELGLDVTGSYDFIEDEMVIYVETDLNLLNIYTLVDLVKTVNL